MGKCVSETTDSEWDIAGMGWAGGRESKPRRAEWMVSRREVCRVDRECMRRTRVNKWNVHAHHIMAADCIKNVCMANAAIALVMVHSQCANSNYYTQHNHPPRFLFAFCSTSSSSSASCTNAYAYRMVLEEGRQRIITAIRRTVKMMCQKHSFSHKLCRSCEMWRKGRKREGWERRWMSWDVVGSHLDSHSLLSESQITSHLPQLPTHFPPRMTELTCLLVYSCHLTSCLYHLNALPFWLFHLTASPCHLQSSPQSPHCLPITSYTLPITSYTFPINAIT